MTPDLLKQSKLTILIVIFVFSARKLVKICYFNPQSILTVDRCNDQYSLKLLAATSTGVLSHQLNIAWMTTFSSHFTGMKNEPSRIETFLEQAVQDQLYLSTTRALLHSILPPVQLVFEHFNPRLKSPICFNHSHNSPSCPAFNIGRITIWKYSHSLQIQKYKWTHKWDGTAVPVHNYAPHHENVWGGTTYFHTFVTSVAWMAHLV